MALQVTQLMHAMSELTFITIFAFASFLEWTAQFRLVAEMKNNKKNVCKTIHVHQNPREPQAHIVDFILLSQISYQLTVMCLFEVSVLIEYAPVYGVQFQELLLHLGCR
jgi:hypothetical protein